MESLEAISISCGGGGTRGASGGGGCGPTAGLSVAGGMGTLVTGCSFLNSGLV